MLQTGAYGGAMFVNHGQAHLTGCDITSCTASTASGSKVLLVPWDAAARAMVLVHVEACCVDAPVVT